ncbi:sialidase family protein [Beduinella massiliensis]|uniref:sialidase family protein n=1 Tax=Beduinella massiliensis TaxID=1852363 RepID=UPI0031FA4537
MNTGSMTPACLLFHPEGVQYRAAGRTWQGIPAIERTRGGTLIAAWYTGMHGEVCGNFVQVERSDDDGLTWTDGWLVVKHDDPAVRCFDPCLWRDPSDRLWLFWAQSGFGQFDGRVGVWACECEAPDEIHPQFSEPRRIANGIMLNKPTVTRSGEWLMPCSLWGDDYVKIAGPGHPELAREVGANVYVSVDEGRTFAHRSGILMPGRVFDEHSIVELADGRLWMLTRCVGGIGQAFSQDSGHTWQEIGPSGHTGPNSRFNITRLSTGELLLINHMNPTNVLDRKPWKRRDNLMAMLSLDDGKSWIGGLMLDTRPEISYPDATEGPDGRIYVVYDHERYKAREILLSVFTIEDVLAGAPVSSGARMREVVSKATGVRKPTMEYD